MKRSKTLKFDSDFHNRHRGAGDAFVPIKVTALMVLIAILFAGCRSGSPGDGGDPAFAHTCRRASNIRSGNDPIYARLNAVRKSRGAAPLFYDRDLATAALAHSAELARSGRLDHKAGPTERLRSKGLVRRSVAENLARFEHRASPRDYVVRYWTAGEREYSNLISKRYVRVGFGLQASPSHCYAVLILTE